MKLLYPMENAPDLLVRPHKGGKTMKLYFYGADKEVTGSCHCLEACGKTFLIDCGLQQGGDDEGGREFPFKASQIDFVIVTHAHIDHSGRLPLLIREGFRGRIFATGATCDLLEIMLLDSARIQEMDAELENRKGRRAGRGKHPALPDPLRLWADYLPCRRHLLYHDRRRTSIGVR